MIPACTAGLVGRYAGIMDLLNAAISWPPEPPAAWVQGWIIPFASPAATIAAAWLFGTWLVRRQKRKELAVEFFKMYHGADMRLARKTTFDCLFPSAATTTGPGPLDHFIEWSTDSSTLAKYNSKTAEFQAVNQVLAFFSACDRSLGHGQVDGALLKSLLGSSYPRWAKIVIDPLIMKYTALSPKPKGEVTPVWTNGLPDLKKLYPSS